jgi:hypothetical protein
MLKAPSLFGSLIVISAACAAVRNLLHEPRVFFVGDLIVPVPVSHLDYRGNVFIANLRIVLDGRPQELTGRDISITIYVYLVEVLSGLIAGTHRVTPFH